MVGLSSVDQSIDGAHDQTHLVLSDEAVVVHVVQTVGGRRLNKRDYRTKTAATGQRALEEGSTPDACEVLIGTSQ